MTIRDQMKLFCTCLCRQDELYAAAARRRGLSFHTLITLYALDQDEGSTQSQLARAWLIPKQTLNTVVKELERQGYVSLCAGKDQKEKRVFLTPEGRDFAADSLRELYAMEDRAVAAVGPERFREMVEANRAFTEAFAQEVRNGSRK